RLLGGEGQGCVGDAVGVVGVPAARESDVQAAPVGGAVDDGAGHIDGDALGTVDGRGVTQLSRCGDVVGVESYPATMVKVPDSQRSVLADLLDPPSVAVLDARSGTGPALGAKTTVVGAGDDDVAFAGGQLVCQIHQTTSLCRSGVTVTILYLGIEVPDGRGGRGQHDAVAAGGGVGEVIAHCGSGHVLSCAAMNPSLFRVEVQPGPIA